MGSQGQDPQNKYVALHKVALASRCVEKGPRCVGYVSALTSPSTTSLCELRLGFRVPRNLKHTLPEERVAKALRAWLVCKQGALARTEMPYISE